MQAKTVSVVDRIVGEEIRSFRIAKHLTEEELANKSGLTADIISSGEQGTRRFAAHELEQLATALGVGLRDIFDAVARANIRSKP